MTPPPIPKKTLVILVRIYCIQCKSVEENIHFIKLSNVFFCVCLCCRIFHNLCELKPLNCNGGNSCHMQLMSCDFMDG